MSIVKIREGKLKDSLRYFYNKTPKIIKYGSRYAKIYKETYDLLTHSQKWSKDQHLEYQLIQMKSLINYSYDHVQYYKELFDNKGITPNDIKTFEDIKKIPLLTKDLIRNNYDKLISNKYRKSELICKSTGGTTGIPTHFYFDKIESMAKEDAFVKIIYDRVGYKDTDRQISFRDSSILNENINLEKNIYWKSIPGTSHLWFTHQYLSNEYLPFYIEKINEFQPIWIKSFPSSLYQLAKFIEETGDNPFKNLVGVIFASENLYKHQIDLFKKVFGNVKLLSVYGHTEMGCIAGTCGINFKYHIQSEYGYSEFIETEGFKELVTTGFNNYSMPLIRYRTNDLFSLSDAECECGRPYQIVDSIEGRLQGILYTKDKRPIADITLDFQGNLNGTLNQVYRYQFIQDSYGECTMLVVPEMGFNESHKIGIEREMNKQFGDKLKVSVKTVDNIPKTSRGKERLVVQNIEM
jgi:phenylacetate-CoA ligase